MLLRQLEAKQVTIRTCSIQREPKELAARYAHRLLSVWVFGWSRAVLSDDAPLVSHQVPFGTRCHTVTV